VTVELQGDERLEYSSEFTFTMSDEERERIRWYLETYLNYPQDPAPKLAERAEEVITSVGIRLFEVVFENDTSTHYIWDRLAPILPETRIEISSEREADWPIPWELMRDPRTKDFLAIRAKDFVRISPVPIQSVQIPKYIQLPLRILLVISRPAGDDDVRFRSVANRIIQELHDDTRKVFRLDVLRPPTFEQLNHVLRAANALGQPYHIVHFDGHGIYSDVGNIPRNLIVSDYELSAKRGYLLFENPSVDTNTQFVDGQALGQVLLETNVSVLILNACSTAYAEPSDSSLGDYDPQVREESTYGLTEITLPPLESMMIAERTPVKAFGSLAQELIATGVPGLIAMNYSVYVVTAAQFVADLYAALTQGYTLGEAVTIGRRKLAGEPLREVIHHPIPLQDWFVPVVYETSPIVFLPKSDTTEASGVGRRRARHAPAEIQQLPQLPLPPDIGFYGRDETLLALDRAFDTQSVVLLHGNAGSGKTSTAVEFARWYSLTGGIEGPVLFTSFERYQPLERVLYEVGQAFEQTLEDGGISWFGLSAEMRRHLILQILHQVDVLWIWDNVDTIAGFSRETDSAWSNYEQQELVEFLRSASQTKAKFLLTSRRDEERLLGGLPVRIIMRPMRLSERVELTRALAQMHGRKLSDISFWYPLLDFTQGNPMTIIVLVAIALRDGLHTQEDIEAFVEKLRTGEDVESDRNLESLTASLNYGLANVVDELERKQLSLLYFFQGFVDVRILERIGDPETDWCLDEVRGLTRKSGVALLDRVVEIGLLTAHDEGYYSVHPAIPWCFKSLFEAYYGESKDLATLAFVEAMGELGNRYHSEYEDGKHEVVSILAAEEANLLHARQLARTHGWWKAVISTMQGLYVLYAHRGRQKEWERLVDEILPDYVDVTTHGPRPGLEEQWVLVTDYRVRLARNARNWTIAESLQQTLVEWIYQRVNPASATADDKGTLAAALHSLAQIQRLQGNPECIYRYKQAIELYRQIDDGPAQAAVAFNLGRTFTGLNISDYRDLEQAERWYQQSLELTPELAHGYAQCVAQLGMVAYERFKEAQANGIPEQDRLTHLRPAVSYYEQALARLPRDAVNDLAVTHNALGIIFQTISDLDRAMPHFREAIRYWEHTGDYYNAGNARFNVALALHTAGRLIDALDYARSALGNFEAYENSVAEEIEKTQQLIGQIETPDKRESPQTGTVVTTPTHSSLATRVTAFDVQLKQLMEQGRFKEAIATCHAADQESDAQSSDSEINEIASIARIRAIQLQLFVDSEKEINEVIEMALKPGQDSHLASIAFAVSLWAYFHTGNTANLKEFGKNFADAYGHDALEYGLQICAYKLGALLGGSDDERMFEPDHVGLSDSTVSEEIPTETSQINWAQQAIAGTDALASGQYAEAAGLFTHATTSVHEVGGDAPSLALSFLCGKALMLMGEHEQGMRVLLNVCQRARSMGLHTLEHKAAISATRIVTTSSGEDNEQRCLSELEYITNNSTARGLNYLQSMFRLGMMQDSVNNLDICSQGYHDFLNWCLDLRKWLPSVPRNFDPNSEVGTYMLIFPSFFPQGKYDERLAGAILLEQLSPGCSFSDIRIETLDSLIYLASLRERSENYSEAAVAWQRYATLKGAPQGGISDGRVPEIEAARLFRQGGEQSKAIEILKAAEEKIKTSADSDFRAQFYREWGRIEIERENLREALEYIRDAERYANDGSNVVLKTQILYLKGNLQLRIGASAWKSTFQQVENQGDQSENPVLKRLADLARRALKEMHKQEKTTDANTKE